MTSAYDRTGLVLQDGDGHVLQSVENALLGGTTGDIATMRHLAVRGREIGPEAALLLALAGLDEDASAIARGETDAMVPTVRHALSLVGLHGVDQHVAKAIAPVMDDASVKADLGPHPGATIGWWDDEFVVWLPTRDRYGNTAVGLGTDRTVSLTAEIPETAAQALVGRPLAELVSHPMILGSAVISGVARASGTTTVHLER